jgi:cytochrome c-type biogenesis protein CcmE
VRIIKLNKQIKKRFIFLIIIFICFASSIVLISHSLKDQIAYFVSPSDLEKMDNIEERYLKGGYDPDK